MKGSVRTHVVRMLDWEESHLGFYRAVAELPAERRGATANGFALCVSNSQFSRETPPHLCGVSPMWTT